VQDETAARADALRMAVEDAKAKAAVLAEAAGFTNLEIENIQENGVYAYDSGANNFAVKAAGMAESTADAATIIHAAKISVNASVVITFEVK
jgi:VCBS repeat-containing protein